MFKYTITNKLEFVFVLLNYTSRLCEQEQAYVALIFRQYFEILMFTCMLCLFIHFIEFLSTASGDHHIFSKGINTNYIGLKIAQMTTMKNKNRYVQCKR